MKIKTVIFVVIATSFLLCGNVFSQNDFNKKLIERQNYLERLEAGRIRGIEEYFFDNLKWGASIDDVKQVYSDTPLFESDSELNYAYDINDTKALLVFEFYYGNLTDIKIIIRTSDNYDLDDSEYRKVYSEVIEYIKNRVNRHQNYADTLKLKDMKRYPLGDPENIESILHIWNFRSTIIKAEYNIAPGIPIMVTFSKKPE